MNTYVIPAKELQPGDIILMEDVVKRNDAGQVVAISTRPRRYRVELRWFREDGLVVYTSGRGAQISYPAERMVMVER